MKKTGSLLALFLLLVVMAAPAQAQRFGGALALGDDEVLVSETRNQAFSGIVYVYQRNNEDGMWFEAAQLKASDAAGAADRFGRALAVEGQTLLVGASARDASTGAVYVFQKEASGAWVEAARLSASDGAEGDAFGSAVTFQGPSPDRSAQSERKHRRGLHLRPQRRRPLERTR